MRTSNKIEFGLVWNSSFKQGESGKTQGNDFDGGEARTGRKCTEANAFYNMHLSFV